jgi:hypothetical protein
MVHAITKSNSANPEGECRQIGLSPTDPRGEGNRPPKNGWVAGETFSIVTQFRIESSVSGLRSVDLVIRRLRAREPLASGRPENGARRWIEWLLTHSASSCLLQFLGRFGRCAV